MGKVTRSLDDIEKLVKKAHQTPEERLKEVNEQLEYQRSVNMNGLVTDKEKILLEAKEILEKQIEEAADKKTLDKIKLQEKQEKQLKKEIKEQLFTDINNNVKEHPQEKHQQVYYLLHDSEVMNDIIKNITKIYGDEFYDYILSIYIKTIEEVYKLYKFSVDLQEKQRKEAQKRLNQKLKRSIAKDAAIVGILKLANKKKNYRR